MNGLNKFLDTLCGLEAIVGHDIIRSNGLAIILCLVSAANVDEAINLATLAGKTDLRPASLDRYIQMLKDTGVVELQYDNSKEWGATGIHLTQRTLNQFTQLLDEK